MDLAAFRASLAVAAPPEVLSPALQALWWEAKGDWDRAHELAQVDEGGTGDWVHAYLHRKEGDTGNAGYWYRRAGKPTSAAPLAEEWATIAAALLAEGLSRSPSGRRLRRVFGFAADRRCPYRSLRRLEARMSWNPSLEPGCPDAVGVDVDRNPDRAARARHRRLRGAARPARAEAADGRAVHLLRPDGPSRIRDRAGAST